MKDNLFAAELCPYDPIGAACMSDIYIKKGDYAGGIKMFNSILKSKYYRIYICCGEDNSDFIEVIDNAYNNLLEKQQAGYVYRPRKKKPTLPPADGE